MDLKTMQSLEKFLEDNEISLYDLKNFTTHKVEKFLKDLFLQYQNAYEKGEPVLEFYLKNGWSFNQLEENIKRQRFVIVSEHLNSQSGSRYFSTGFTLLEHAKHWFLNFKDGSFVPIFLIENGKTNFDTTFEMEHSVRMIGGES